MAKGIETIMTGEPTRTAQSLAAALAQLRFDGMTSTAVTRLVTRAVEDWAEGLGWLAVAEMPLDFLADTPERPGRQGYVDLYIARPGYKRDVVIEIDRANKVWSAQKLGHAVSHGKAAIWVRWKGYAPSPEIVPQGVEVIHLGLRRALQAVAAEPAGYDGAGSSQRRNTDGDMERPPVCGSAQASSGDPRRPTMVHERRSFHVD